MKKETKSLVVRFSDKISETETTHERVKAIADRLGISQNKAVHYAINLAHNQIIGQQVGCITYLGAPQDAIQRAQERVAQGVPMAHTEDDQLEKNLFFSLLPEATKKQAHEVTDPAEKRKIIKQLIQEHFLDEEKE